MSAMLHTPWSDEITLIWRKTTMDASGFETVTEHRSDPPLFCDFEDGVSQSEFYLSMKAGLRASAQIQIWKADYAAAFPAGTAGERFVDFAGRHFKVLRDFPQDSDTQTLILTEVIR